MLNPLCYYWSNDCAVGIVVLFWFLSFDSFHWLAWVSYSSRFWFWHTEPLSLSLSLFLLFVWPRYCVHYCALIISSVSLHSIASRIHDPEDEENPRRSFCPRRLCVRNDIGWILNNPYKAFPTILSSFKTAQSFRYDVKS